MGPGYLNPNTMPSISNSNPNYWTLLNTGGSADLAKVLDILSPQALDNYLPFKAKKQAGFTKGLHDRYLASERSEHP